jgi:hypothetical protein
MTRAEPDAWISVAACHFFAKVQMMGMERPRGRPQANGHSQQDGQIPHEGNDFNSSQQALDAEYGHEKDFV